MYRGRFWTMRMYAGFSTAEESNKRYRYLLANGGSGLSCAFDLPTQIGYDSTDAMAEGEVGKVGVAIDLAVISAILSSNMDTEIEAGVCMAGEVGLSGEIRPVNRIEQRISEAEKLGFTRMLVPKHNLQGLDRKKIKIELVPVRKVEEAFRQLFG